MIEMQVGRKIMFLIIDKELKFYFEELSWFCAEKGMVKHSRRSTHTVERSHKTDKQNNIGESLLLLSNARLGKDWSKQ